MRSIALTNQKGGVAKTTTTVNLGACLAQMGKKVLVVDLDPQGNLSSWLGLDIHNLERSMYNVFLEEVHFEEILTKTCFDTIIKENTRLAECPISGKPITLYAPDSSGAIDYTNLAKEVVQREKNI